MSLDLMTRVWGMDIPSTAKMVLLSLADQAKDNGVCWPSQPQIAKRCSLTERAVRSQLLWLEGVGYLHRTVKAGVGTTFVLTLPETEEPRNDVPPRNNIPPRNDVPATPEQYSGNPGTTFRQTISKRKEPEAEGDTPPVSSKAADLCPYQQIIDAYHEAMPENPRCKILSASRKAAIKARWTEAAKLTCKPFGYASRVEGLNAWRRFFEICADSDFLTGKAPGSNGRPSFVADIDFLMRPQRFAQILENKYHREAAA